MLMQTQCLFAASAEHKRISTFQPADPQSLERLAAQQKADILLFHRVATGCLSDVDLLSARARVVKQTRVAEVVINDDVRLTDAPHAFHGNQTRISRTRPDQPYPSAPGCGSTRRLYVAIGGRLFPDLL